MAENAFGVRIAKVDQNKFSSGYEGIKWGNTRSKMKTGKPARTRGSLLTSNQRKANEVAYDVLRYDIRESLKRGDYDGAPLSTRFNLTGETMRDMLHNRNPQGGDVG